MNDCSTVLTIGNFDGIHLGHRHLIQMTIDLARSRAGRAVAMTFTPHPRQFFNPVAHFFLHPEPVKLRLLASLGLDEVLCLPFDKIHRLSPAEFFSTLLLPLEPSAIVLGDNFFFGSDKSGDIQLLRRFCAQNDIALHSLVMKPYRGLPVSSSRIRSALQAGRIDEANAMLTEPYTLYGRIEKGAQRGHTLGFATANIHAPTQVVPKNGVYVTHVFLDESRESWPAVTAVTNTPTFGNVETVIESHILDFHEDIYGHDMRVQFHAFLRDEMTFSSREALVSQLHQDCDRARQFQADLSLL